MKQKTFRGPGSVDALLTISVMVKRTQKAFLIVRHVMFRNVLKRTETALNYARPIENLFCRTNAFTKTDFDWYSVSSVYNI